MDKSRLKRPPDVNEALSSMLWTPYEQPANTSSSSDSLTEDERQRGQRKLNRYSNPLPNSLNWWNCQNASSRYSFPYSGSYVPPLSANDNFSSATTTKRTVSTTIDVRNHEQTINTSTFSTTMVHSYTDDFYHYQNQMPQNFSNCQSTHKNHKSQPSLLCDSFSNPSPNERINTHLAPPSSFSSTITTHDDKLFNHQRNNVRNTQTYEWQKHHEKAGNVGDLNPYVHEDSSKKPKQQGTCTNTTLYGEEEEEEKLWKVTQPPNAIRSYSTVNRCNERRGNKHNEQERNIVRLLPTQQDSKTLLRMVGEGMAATKQISHIRDSRENAAECLASNFYRPNRHGDDEKYRLLQDRSNINRMEHLSEHRVIHGDERYVGDNINCVTPPSTTTSIANEAQGLGLSGNCQRGSHVQQQQIQHIPVSLTNNFASASLNAPYEYYGASNTYPSWSGGPCTSSASVHRSEEFEHKLSEDIARSIDVDSLDYSESNDGIECIKRCRGNIENDINRANNAAVVVEIDCERRRVESEMCDVKYSQSTDDSSSKADVNGPILNADNLIITSAIENLSSTIFDTSGTPCKAKYSNDIVTVRAKRRRDRRDRRLARTRATNAASLSSSTNEILPDIVNNHLPPPYADIPPQQIVPSIVSTVPVEDNRYTFSLPLVRRSTSDRSGKDCCGQWFNGPPLRFLVVLVALGGVACTLGGATLGSIALAGSPTSHLTAGLLMTGVGIVLVTISGVAWRMTISDSTHQCTGRCGRRQCARGNSSFGLLYPEFQHRPPPPSYQASMQEHRLREMMLNRERQASNARASPPPTYRSNAGTLLRPPLLFQRQSCNANNVQVEIPIDNSPLSNNLINGHSSMTREYAEHQSPTSSQTITTIASINRLSDNEFTLMSASRELVTDVTSLIKQNDVDIEGNVGKREEGSEARHHVFHENLKCSGSRSSSRSSSRCTTDAYSDRNINCNKDSVRVTDHTTAVNHCKNVNKELNKAPLTHLAPSSRGSLMRDGRSILNGARYEMGVR